MVVLIVVTQEEPVVTKVLQMFEGRTDDLDRILVAAGVPSKDLKDPGKREGLLMQFVPVIYHLNDHRHLRN